MRARRAEITREMDLCGTAGELTKLAEILQSDGGSVSLSSYGDPSPYDFMLKRLEVTLTSGAIVIRCLTDSGVLQIRGGAAQFELLALNVQDYADEGDSMSHLHIDYFPGHDYLAESSESLVIALLADASSAMDGI